MTINAVKRKYFERGNVCVTGLRGCGKDMLIANVVVRRKLPYVSNVDYTNDERYNPFDYNTLKVPNNYKNFIEGHINPYVYPYPESTDVYISDVGVYFPSQYCNELNRDYKELPVLMALSRQLGDFNVHINVQNLNRAWDKLREQSDTYISCLWCKVLFGGRLVIQKIRIYEKYQSCVDRVKPCKIHVPLRIRADEAKAIIQTHKDSHENAYGKIIDRILIYRNKSPYDTRIFKSILQGGSTE